MGSWFLCKSDWCHSCIRSKRHQILKKLNFGQKHVIMYPKSVIFWPIFIKIFLNPHFQLCWVHSWDKTEQKIKNSAVVSNMMEKIMLEKFFWKVLYWGLQLWFKWRPWDDFSWSWGARNYETGHGGRLGSENVLYSTVYY